MKSKGMSQLLAPFVMAVIVILVFHLGGFIIGLIVAAIGFLLEFIGIDNQGFLLEFADGIIEFGAFLFEFFDYNVSGAAVAGLIVSILIWICVTAYVEMLIADEEL